MNLSLSRSSDEGGVWVDSELESTVTEIAASLEPGDGSIDLILVGDDYIRTINAEYRGKDSPTDVISFSYLDDGSPAVVDDLVGEIYISYDTLEKEAKLQGLNQRHLFLRVAVHGLFHVLGHDHRTDEAAAEMEGLERECLSRYLSEQDVEALF